MTTMPREYALYFTGFAQYRKGKFVKGKNNIVLNKIKGKNGGNEKGVSMW